MTARMDWEKAKRREQSKSEPDPTKFEQQLAISLFVEKHRLVCFACHGKRGDWAKSGISKRGPWVVCVPCVESRSKRSAARPHGPIAEA